MRPHFYFILPHAGLNYTVGAELLSISRKYSPTHNHPKDTKFFPYIQIFYMTMCHIGTIYDIFNKIPAS